MPREIYINFVLYQEDGAELNEESVEFLVEEFIEASGQTGLSVFGSTTSDEIEDADIVEGADVCDKCGGQGYVEPESTVESLSEDEWGDLYGEKTDSAPIAQRIEHSSPKRKAEGSNPSRSANNVREHRQNDREDGRQDSTSDSEGDRSRCEDPG